MNIHANKGMYLEEMLNKTCAVLNLHDDFLMFKYHTKMVIVHHKFRKYVANNFVDYFGYCHQQCFVIEAKQVNTKNFSLHNLSEHQILILKKLVKMQIPSFVLIYFNLYDQFYLVDAKDILFSVDANMHHLKYQFIKEKGTNIALRIPGILDLEFNLTKLLFQSK
ncbi:Holliday junction resolvase RecU [bacterium]|nr:Holliday junction resolvase RecU [bacterium]MBP5783721.1 Holliday junction resolvase RecU [bacterium]